MQLNKGGYKHHFGSVLTGADLVGTHTNTAVSATDNGQTVSYSFVYVETGPAVRYIECIKHQEWKQMSARTCDIPRTTSKKYRLIPFRKLTTGRASTL